MIDQEKIKEGVRLLLGGHRRRSLPGGSHRDPGPDRKDVYRVIQWHGRSAFHTFIQNVSYRQYGNGAGKDITFYSTCEHHMLPFFGKVHIAYVPDGKVVA